MSAKYSIVEGSTSDKGKCYLFRIHEGDDPLHNNSMKPISKGIPHLYLGGGFLMPSFGDGHAHPLYGGLESAGPAVRPCKSVDEIVTAVKTFAADNPVIQLIGIGEPAPAHRTVRRKEKIQQRPHIGSPATATG